MVGTLLFLLLGITCSYTHFMKTAISVPNPVFEQAEELARRLRISRSELYTQALKELLTTYRDIEITAKLDEVYAAESSDLDPLLAHLQASAVSSITADGAEEW